MEINKPVSTIIILVISLILIFLFAFPKYQESSALQMKLDEKIAEYNGKSAYFEKIAETLRDIESKKDFVQKISSALPSDLYFSPIVYFLHRKGIESGLINKSIVFSQGSASSARPQASPSNKEIKNVSFTLNMSGSYDGLKNFLASLERSSRLFEVKTISFSSGQALQVQGQPKNQLQIYDFKLGVVTHTY